MYLVHEELGFCGGDGQRGYSPKEIEKIRKEIEKDKRDNEDFIWQKYKQEESKIITSDIHFS
ncbi:MAG: hypothetical protein LBQ34_02865 [Alphaproteobacteria bacterium]|jgi:hypothetical protein|nr:hypothetical protein [Alphaproteobacteria bacterium]